MDSIERMHGRRTEDGGRRAFRFHAIPAAAWRTPSVSDGGTDFTFFVLATLCFLSSVVPQTPYRDSG